MEGPPVMVRITKVWNNDLFRVAYGVDLDGKEHSHGLYTDEQLARISHPLTEMEVLAWSAKKS